MQSLYKILFCFLNGIAPNQGEDMISGMDQMRWEKLIENAKFVDLMTKFEENLSIIQEKFSALIELFKTTNQEKYENLVEILEYHQNLDVPLDINEVVHQINKFKDEIIK